MEKDKLKAYCQGKEDMSPKQAREVVSTDPEAALIILCATMGANRTGRLLLNYVGGRGGMYRLINDHPEWGIDMGVAEQI